MQYVQLPDGSLLPARNAGEEREAYLLAREEADDLRPPQLWEGGG